MYYPESEAIVANPSIAQQTADQYAQIDEFFFRLRSDVFFLDDTATGLNISNMLLPRLLKSYEELGVVEPIDIAVCPDDGQILEAEEDTFWCDICDTNFSSDEYNVRHGYRLIKRVIMSKPERTQVFISYSRKDKIWLERLQTHLKPFTRKGLDVWDDTRIETSQEWEEEVKKALAAAKVAVLIVTPNFWASDYIMQNELQPLLEAAKREGLKIVWIAASASAYKGQDIAKYQAANDPNVPLDTLSRAKRNKALVDICEDIEKLVNA